VLYVLLSLSFPDRRQMARQQVERMVDDLDGSDASETVSFGLDGTSFEIDLSKKNAAALRKALARYIGAGRTTGGAARRTTTSRPKKNTPRRSNGQRNYEISELREWAGANKIKVPARGRIPSTIVEQYLTSR
jgi:hypothetical protein